MSLTVDLFRVRRILGIETFGSGVALPVQPAEAFALRIMAEIGSTEGGMPGRTKKKAPTIRALVNEASKVDFVMPHDHALIYDGSVARIVPIVDIPEYLNTVDRLLVISRFF